ncbi:hypothetical protein CkaCkLH20_01070 [Colletotrichum karsti]|uniref:Large ribosomal subunit protein uL29m n=1 Tax=Colletotrichum karsti TaxID=1095194 RepID=A0A9P6LMW4_9PEZI|nr:uncharacterized protein CkaCkLH20_01070 [Colletotrichum karsti]KAF9881924.1 hypothetical protein CkaCkLH20_01070 [Colletotrichum karsti]
MANPNALRPSIGRVLRLQETRQWLPSTSTSAPIAQPRIATSCFSTSSAHAKRVTRDNNRLRGVSTMKRTGPREKLSVSWEEIPRPADYKPTVAVDPNHGLWDFFYGKKLLQTPKEDESHGRPWETEELRKKSWNDLHALWYVCLKERNRILTASKERTRRQLGFGALEASGRDETVRITMRRIKHVLTERYYVWEDARQLAHFDPDIDMKRQPMYRNAYDRALMAAPGEESMYERELPAEASAEQKTEPATGVEHEIKPAEAEAEKAPEKPKEEKKKAVEMPVPKL